MFFVKLSLNTPKWRRFRENRDCFGVFKDGFTKIIFEMLAVFINCLPLHNRRSLFINWCYCTVRQYLKVCLLGWNFLVPLWSLALSYFGSCTFFIFILLFPICPSPICTRIVELWLILWLFNLTHHHIFTPIFCFAGLKSLYVLVAW